MLTTMISNINSHFVFFEIWILHFSLNQIDGGVEYNMNVRIMQNDVSVNACKSLSFSRLINKNDLSNFLRYMKRNIPPKIRLKIINRVTIKEMLANILYSLVKEDFTFFCFKKYFIFILISHKSV